MPVQKPREKRQIATRRAISAEAVRAARIEAAAQIERREQRDAAARQLAVNGEMRSQVDGGTARKLRIKAHRLLADLKLDPVALPGEDVAAATRRVLAERGATDDQIADLTTPGVEHDSAARKAAERARKRRLSNLERELAVLDDEWKALQAWRAENERLRANGEPYARSFASTPDLETKRERLAATIANLKVKNRPGPRR